jgi:hypothetical protein
MTILPKNCMPNDPVVIAAWPTNNVVLIRSTLGQSIPIMGMFATNNIRFVKGMSGTVYTLLDSDDIGILD